MKPSILAAVGVSLLWGAAASAATAPFPINTPLPLADTIPPPALQNGPMPHDVAAPPGTEVYKRFRGKGYQVLMCNDEGKPKLFYPYAGLYNYETGVREGTHMKGKDGAKWTSLNGADGVEANMSNHADAPDVMNDLDWLEGSVVAHFGSGDYGPADAVQRVYTLNGKTQITVCKPGEILIESYEADYYLLRKILAFPSPK